MEREPELEAPNLLHRERWDPGLLKAFGVSAAALIPLTGNVSTAATAPAAENSADAYSAAFFSPSVPASRTPASRHRYSMCRARCCAETELAVMRGPPRSRAALPR